MATPTVASDVKASEGSYFDEARRGFLSAPFPDARAEEEFKIPLGEWSAFTDKHLAERRAFYRCGTALTLADLQAGAPIQQRIKTAAGGELVVLVCRTSVTDVEVDAAVNAANESLLGGGGVDFAIHQAAGSNLVRECAQHDGCEVAQCVITKGYDMPAKFVLHTVGPLLQEDGSPDRVKLAACYRACLDCCDAHGLRSVIFPCISCGFYGFPFPESAHVVKQVIDEYARKADGQVQVIAFSVFDDAAWAAYKHEWET